MDTSPTIVVCAEAEATAGFDGGIVSLGGHSFEMSSTIQIVGNPLHVHGLTSHADRELVPEGRHWFAAKVPVDPCKRPYDAGRMS
jgi:hypothetical protein